MDVKWRGRAVAGQDLGINEGPGVSGLAVLLHSCTELEAETGFMGDLFCCQAP